MAYEIGALVGRFVMAFISTYLFAALLYWTIGIFTKKHTVWRGLAAGSLSALNVTIPVIQRQQLMPGLVHVAAALVMIVAMVFHARAKDKEEKGPPKMA